MIDQISAQTGFEPAPIQLRTS